MDRLSTRIWGRDVMVREQGDTRKLRRKKTRVMNRSIKVIIVTLKCQKLRRMVAGCKLIRLRSEHEVKF